METVQQNGRFTLFSSKFLSIYSILYAFNPRKALSCAPSAPPPPLVFIKPLIHYTLKFQVIFFIKHLYSAFPLSHTIQYT